MEYIYCFGDNLFKNCYLIFCEGKNCLVYQHTTNVFIVKDVFSVKH